MNRYLEHMHQKPAHERRRHAMRVAGVITAVIFAGWVTSFSLHLGSAAPAPVASSGTAASQTAAAIQGSGYPTSGNQLIVATTTDY